MSSKPYRTALIVGRFQTFHKGHEDIVNTALKLSERVNIFIGSAQESGTAKNPFSYRLRHDIIKEIYGEKVNIYPLRDIGVGNNSRWGEYVMKTAFEVLGEYPQLSVSGREARRTSWLDGEKGADVTEIFVPKTVDISAAKMREFLLGDQKDEWQKYVNKKLWYRYDQLRQILLAAKDNLESDSI